MDSPVARAEGSDHGAARRTWRIVVPTLIVVLSWALVFARAIPQRDGDRGVFASMAERLAAGDTLYVDVWDNKEPLFYLTLGLGRLVSPYMDVLIELLWLAACALAAWALLRRSDVSGPMAAVVGLALTPLTVTGAIYNAGFSHLPGIALVLASYALLRTGHPLIAGLLLPVLAAFKVVMVPVLLAVLLVGFLLDRDRRVAVRYAIGVAASVVGLTLLLAMRGELRGYIDLLLSNVGYSQSPISDAYQIPIWVHVEPVMHESAVALLAGVIAVLALTRLISPRAARNLWWTTAATTIASLAVIALTGLWPHHGQILYVPAVLALLLLVVAIPQAHRLSLTSLVLTVAAMVILSGAPSLRTVADTVLSARTRWNDLALLAPPSRDLLAIAQSGSYARLGKNTDDSHAQGLSAFTHPCYQFVQYTYDLPSTLELIPTCLPSVDYVIVDKGLVPEEGQDRWNTFVARSEAVLRSAFTCDPRPWGRLCVNNRITQERSNQ